MPHAPRPVLGRVGRSSRWIALAAALACAAPAAAQLRVVSYNIVGLLGDQASLRNVIASFHTDDKPGFATPAAILVFCEVRTTTVAALQTLVNQAAPPGITYALGTFTGSSAEDSSGGSRAVFYRTDLLSEIAASHQDISTGAGRFTDRWQFQLVGYTSPAARFYVYGAHLKASSGSTNEATRLSGVQAIRANSDALGAGVRALYAGDMNFYTSGESGYQAYLAAGSGAAFDPIMPSGDWTGATNAWMHTQSPRDIAANGLVGGGMDDRFDFILPTAQLVDGTGLSYIAGTYRVPGNDGNHYNLAVNAGTNTYFPGNVGRSNTLANQLFAAADHLPVLADFRVPAWNTAVLGTVPARVIQGAAATVQVRVANDAPADVAAGVDPLAYVVAGSGVLSGTFNGTAVLTPAFTAVNVPIVTTTIGVRTGTATVTSTNEAVQNPSIALPVSVRIVRASNPSFSAAADQNTVAVPITVPAGSTAPVDATVSVSNFGFTADQSTMDIDSVQVPSGPWSFVSGTATGIGATPGTVRVRFSPAGLAPGTYSAAVTVRTSDENVPGEGTASVVATFTATIASGRPEDINNDGVVDGADLGLLLSAWGQPGITDLNGDGTTDGGDLGILLASWG
jgi:hypothetical protein